MGQKVNPHGIRVETGTQDGLPARKISAIHLLKTTTFVRY